jgi:nucleotide-binding universal stress UspA family protein
LGGLTRREGFALACGMNARGSTEVIIATVGLSMGAINQNLFTMIVAMAVTTTLAMPPTLRWALARIPMRKEEKQRLEREEQEEKGFVANLERLLIAVDDSPNGKFASRVAGMLAGTHGMPTTVLHIKDAAKIEDKKLADKNSLTKDPKAEKAAEKKADAKKSEKEDSGKEAGKDEKSGKVHEKKAEKAGDTVKQAAELIKSKQKEEEKVDTPVEVTTIVHEAPGPDVIAAEAKKGYDLMLIGVAKTTQRSKDFHDSVQSLAKGFEGPLAITDLRGDLAEKPTGKLNILVPVNGTEPSRRAAEIAITMARANKASLMVLYVAVGGNGKRRGIRTRRHEESILKDIVAIADGYNMSIRTAVVANNAADDAILNEAKRRKNNLIVMGVGRRPGEKLFFGDTASSLLEEAECSLLFVAS